VILPELVEDRDHHLPDAVALVARRLGRARQQPLQRPFVVAFCERAEDLGELAAGRELLEELRALARLEQGIEE